MRHRAADLANQFEAVHREVVAFCETLPDTDWETFVPNEERTVGVLIQHIAVAYTAETNLIRAIVDDQPLPEIYDDRTLLNEMNASDAVSLRSGTKADALRMLDDYAGETARFLRTLNDDDLAKARPLGLFDGAVWSVEKIISTIVLGHPQWHLRSIRAVLPAASSTSPS